ncbi:hypothetical protein M407DRAFT_219498 [Tulasnella calospora MUT 4182]|uniref:Derlin n=1 Tax=Tulasnella calospora MUT 4182 TaxID=1051891 RepID=A0A0C3PZL3_9AGAM|nr:hypothetical protein M407DRAFT_219498 [Tulasnella calospora MUT 4182]
MYEIRKIPPVTRTLVGATLGMTFPIILTLLPGYWVLFIWKLVKRGQVWRIPTQNSGELESGWYPRRSADYAYQLILASILILALNMPLGTLVHYRALLSCITYLSTRLSPETPVSILGLVTIRAFYFPFALLFLDLISEGPGAAIVSLTGVLAGHIWYLLEWTPRGPRRPGQGMGAVVGRAPNWLIRLIGQDREASSTVGSSERRPYGEVVVPRDRQPTATNKGYTWGRGQRLGSE